MEDAMSVSVDFLILGHPRSGTGYMAQLFTALGLPVGHEKVEPHGISSWMFAVDAPTVPYTFDGKTRRDILPRYVFQVVRDPLDVVASMAYTVPEEDAWKFIAQYAPVERDAPSLIRAAQSVIGWNRLIAKHDPHPTIVNVESAALNVHEFLLLHGYHPRALDEATLPPTNYNTRPHARLTSHYLAAQLPADLFADLRRHAGQYGYRL